MIALAAMVCGTIGCGGSEKAPPPGAPDGKQAPGVPEKV